MRHIVCLKRNLISLDALDSKGCNFSGLDGAMRFRKLYRIVCKANKLGNLYVLNMSTIRIGEISIWVPKVFKDVVARSGATDVATSNRGDKLKEELT